MDSAVGGCKTVANEVPEIGHMGFFQLQIDADFQQV